MASPRHRIVGTSPNGTPWYHSNYPSLSRAMVGMEDVIRSERKGSGDARWDAAERGVIGLPLRHEILLPNGWTFRVEPQPEE